MKYSTFFAKELGQGSNQRSPARQPDALPLSYTAKLKKRRKLVNFINIGEKFQYALKFGEIVAISLKSMPYIIFFQFVMLVGNGPKIIVRAPLWKLQKFTAYHHFFANDF